MTGHISTGYEPKSSGSGGGILLKYNAYNLRGLLFTLVVYTLCGASALQSIELQRSLGDAAVRNSTLNLRFDLFKKVCDRTFQ